MGQTGTVDIEQCELQLIQTVFSRKHASNEDIKNISHAMWGLFDFILKSDTDPNSKSKKLHMYLERLSDILEPETVKSKKIGVVT